MRRLNTGGALLITPAPISRKLEVVYPLPYQRLSDSMILQVLDEHYSLKIKRRWLDGTSEAVPDELVREMESADADQTDRESEVTGAVKVVTSLASADGLVLLNPVLGVLGFGVKIRAGPRVATVYDGPEFTRRDKRAKKIDPSHYGTRHSSMLRYCRADRAAVGIVVSQDGNVRLIMSAGQSVTMWDNVKLLRHQTYSRRLARRELKRRTHRSRRPQKVQLGYTSMPKTIKALLKLNSGYGHRYRRS